jgi:hypothetical protein
MAATAALALLRWLVRQVRNRAAVAGLVTR